ncbi:uncharacterized protein LOC112043792 [Bicyclus anynana]|uniref:Uncharacterized protein LOC112043792 n=1 Tax=Bicyclus anynana TaxID=110368 RepID=A0A6J1MX84_BICAN|nr:uncharacterized protein LOC112043792 [Bicyclus anynana]
MAPIIIEAWQRQALRSARELQSEYHHHSKRHMLPRDVQEERHVARRQRRTTTPRMKELRKKPSGNLKPLEEDDIENDEIVSVAIVQPAMRPKYDKFKHIQKPNRTTVNDSTRISTNIVKDVLIQLGREFLTHQVNEDFVFGQYIGNSMRNLTNDLRLMMQHDILDIIVKYQKLNRGEVTRNINYSSTPLEIEVTSQPIVKAIKVEKKNETEEVWPEFTNLANIVG